MLMSLDPDFRYYLDIAGNCDTEDLRYLYRYGRNISRHELRTASFFRSYPVEKLKELAGIMVKAYVNGFERSGKDLEDGTSLMMMCPVGYEKLVGILIEKLEDMGLKPILTTPSTTNLNRQVTLDHKFDATLWITDEIVEENIARFDNTMSGHSGLAESFRGILALTVFGEKPFQPKDKPESPKPSEEEMQRFRKFRMGMMMVREKYIPRQKGSFSVIAFPSPEIGDKFEEIFQATLEVNSSSEDVCRKLQQKLIEALDGADRLHIKGAEGNRTDLTVSLQQPEDPNKQTVFMNCLADINIPVGEVFTSPRLEGTTGVLHVEHVKLKNMTFKDLEIVFRDGFTEDFTCGNFDSREKGREFVAQQLLFPHEKLPMGEFAIGTNTLAYEMAMRFGIMDLLPVLLIEKMGPHLAIGDTCFAHEEDHPVKNPDGREVVARDNEMTQKRKDDPDSAYTEAHTDISLPYHMIEHIKAVTSAGVETYIIRNGVFAPDSLRELNRPLKRLNN